MAEENDRKRARSCSSLDVVEEVDLPEVKKLKKDLLENLEEDEICSTGADLDSLLKSFEDEISTVPVTDLGYLLEASDDELGLPPTRLGEEEVAELLQVSSDSDELTELWGYDSFELGVSGMENGNDFLPFEGLFDFSDMGFGSADFVC